MLILGGIILLLIGAIYLFMKQAQFGRAPSGTSLERIKRSDNFKDGKFHNLHYTPQLTEGYSMGKVMYEFFFKKAERRVPDRAIPSIKTNLHSLSREEDVLVWFGHSSYFMQIDGKRMLVDPVFSGSASPIRAFNKAFKGSNIYKVEDLPEIDVLFVSHDHYDHADYPTLLKLRNKVKRVICALGVGGHLERWGYAPEMITETDWGEDVNLGDGFKVYTKAARHFSGRAFSRNNSLWVSWLLQTPSMKIYLGADSGYDSHFSMIGRDHGPIDLAILENGQYDIKWKYIHMLPNEVLKAAKDLGAKRLLPVHSGKFAMANHAWDAPLREITELNEKTGMPLLTPKIGEVVRLKDENQGFERWWL